MIKLLKICICRPKAVILQRETTLTKDVEIKLEGKLVITKCVRLDEELLGGSQNPNFFPSDKLAYNK